MLAFLFYFPDRVDVKTLLNVCSENNEFIAIFTDYITLYTYSLRVQELEISVVFAKKT